MQKRITTVLGDISPQSLGYTSLHDHTFLDLTPSAMYMESIFMDIDRSRLAFVPENYNYLKTGCFLLNEELRIVDDAAGLEKEYGYFKALGGQSVVDPTPIGARPAGYPEKIAALSEKTGLNFITATGFYHDAALPEELKQRGTEYYYQFMRREIESGIDGTAVRPGCLKGAFNTLSDTEQSIVEACLRLSAETGLSAHIHTEPTVDAEDLISTLDRLCEKTGASHDRVHICHMDNRLLAGTMVTDFLEDLDTQRALELDVQKALLDRGYSIGLDTWGMPIQNENLFMPDDFDRLKALIMLLDAGYEDQITLGNDFSNKIEWRQYGGYGCTRFADFGLRLLNLLGREEQAHKLVYENPASILAY